MDALLGLSRSDGDSDSDMIDYEQQEEKSKADAFGAAPTAADRRFVLSDDDGDDVADEHPTKPSKTSLHPLDASSGDDSEPTKTKPIRTTRSVVKPITPAQLAKFQAAAQRTGILYMSRIPPYMSPERLRQLLAPFGEIGRIYLAEEDAHARKKRVERGGNKRALYIEGWIEFKDKTVAKAVAASLNAQPIGGPRRSFYREDLWTLKYLPKFKWNHLTERVAYEKASREQRLRAELAQAQRGDKAYIANVERAKMVEGMQERAKKRAGANGSVNEEAPEPPVKVRRTFAQHKTVQSEVAPGASRQAINHQRVSVDAELSSVLGKIF